MSDDLMVKVEIEESPVFCLIQPSVILDFRPWSLVHGQGVEMSTSPNLSEVFYTDTGLRVLYTFTGINPFPGNVYTNSWRSTLLEPNRGT